MKNRFGWLFVVGMLSSTLNAQQAVLYTGSDWCQITPHVQALWEAESFQSTIGVSTLCYDVPDVKPQAPTTQQLKAYELPIERFPAVAYFNTEGRCVYLAEGLPLSTTTEDLKAIIMEGKARASLFDHYLTEGTVEGVAKTLQILIENVGLFRARKPRLGEDLWPRLKALDPEDKTGWNFALSYDPLEGFCYEIQKFANDKKYAEGEARLKEINAKETAHLSLNQRQAIALLPFILYKDVPEKRETCVDILKQVVAMGTETHFGAGALGYLCMWGEGPVALPYGWTAKHLSKGENTWTLDIGTNRFIPEAGRYALTITRRNGSGEMKVLNFSGNCLSVETPLDKPITIAPKGSQDLIFETTIDGPTLTLTVEVENPEKNEGNLTIRRLLPAREKIQAHEKVDLSTYAFKGGDPIVKAYALETFATVTLETIAAREKGADFLKAFFANQSWMEEFFAAGEPLTTWDNALFALEEIYTHLLASESLSLPERRWATAAALNAQADATDVFHSFKVLQASRRKGLLIKGMDDLRVDQMRFAFATKQGDADAMAWIVNQHHVNPSAYAGVCWFAAYRLHNFFGDSIHGPRYYRPWEHCYVRHENARKIGGVCGSLSHYGCMAARAHGLPATTGGQPAHCAYVLWQPRMGRWEIDYNVNAYTGAHFLPWKDVWTYATLDLQNELFANSNYLAAMRLLWKVETVRRKRIVTPERSPMTCTAYEWTGNKLPTDLSKLTKLGHWTGVKDFAINRTRKDNVFYLWRGTLTMEEEGALAVEVKSDDGAKIWIDGQPIAGEDGLHGMRGSREILDLSKGRHTFEVRYFNRNEGAGLEVTLQPVERYSEKLAAAYAHVGKLVPENLNLWRAYADYLKQCDDFEEAPAAWLTLAKAAAKGMGHHLGPVWDFLNQRVLPSLVDNANQEHLLKVLITLHQQTKQGPQQTAEFCDYEAILNGQVKRLNDKEAHFALFEAVLHAQYGTRDAFGRVIRWGSQRFFEDETLAKRYIAALNQCLDKDQSAGDVLSKYVREAILGASKARNLVAFQSLCDLQDRLQPKTRQPIFNEATFASKDYLCSDKGLLRLSSTSRWDHPFAYRHVIDRYAETDAFHTAEEVGPWAEVELEGPSEVTAIYLKNTTGNQSRLVPFVIEASEDGTQWTTIATETAVKNDYWYSPNNVNARFVRVRCTSKNKTFLHLRKMMIFGKKRY